MTVTTSINKVQALGNGVTTSFPYSFRIYSAADLVVTSTVIATGIDTVLVLNTDYTVTGAGSYNGGNVVIPSAPITGARITILRVEPVTQATDLRNQGAYFAETHEDVFDKLTMIDQQQQEILDRTLRFPASDSATPSFPTAASRANNLLAFDSNGDPVAVAPAAQSATALQALLAASGGAGLVGSLPAGTGAAAITVGAQLNKIQARKIYVTDAPYYCLGDGSDESAKLSAALNSGAREVVIPEGVFVGKAITVTSATLRRISGAGTIKLANAANTFLLNFTGTNELIVRGPTIDGNKANQSGATPATRSSYILINLTDVSTVGTQFNGVKFINAYYGAAINNSGIRTSIIGNWFYDCGSSTGTCDAIFNGTAGDAQAIIARNYIHNCDDYGIACDASGVKTYGNRISNCFAGIGALTRGTISSHDHFNNTIVNCVRPFDYFNSATDSAPANTFIGIKIHGNLISASTATGAAISFSANNATLKLCADVQIYQNTIATELNAFSAIYVSGVAAAKNTSVRIYDNICNGDSVTQSARYAINVNNTTGLALYENEFNGVDLAYSVTNCTGRGYDNTFRVLRDCYGAIENSTFDIREKFKAIPRRCLFVSSGSIVTLDAEFDTVTAGIYIYDAAGTLPVNTLYIDRMVTKGVNANVLYADATLAHQITFNSQPAQISRITANTVQGSWNITGAPTSGTWVQGQESYSLTPVVGQPKGWRCTVAGTPGTWVSEGNL